MMCEMPSNALLADEFLDHFDGFSIGSNDLTQLTLGWTGTRRSSPAAFDERDPAVLRRCWTWRSRRARARGKYIGICGQGPCDHPDFAEWLLAQGIDSMSLNPDTVVETWQRLGKVEVHAPGKAGVPIPRLVPVPAPARMAPKVLAGQAAG